MCGGHRLTGFPQVAVTKSAECGIGRTGTAFAEPVAMSNAAIVVVSLSLVATACVAEDPGQPAPVAFSPSSTRAVADLGAIAKQPLRSILADGTYRVESDWDLRSAIAGDSLGDTLATLLITEAVSAIGVPSWWQDDAEAALRVLVHDPLASFVDNNTPDIVGGQNGLLAQLGDIVSDVQVVSHLVLTELADGTTVGGREEIVAVRLSYDGRSVDVPVSVLAAASGAGTIESSFTAARTGRGSLAVPSHAVVLAADPLVALGLEGLLSINDVAAYAEQAIDCNVIVAAVTGGDGLSLSFAGQTISVGEGTLVSACEAVRGEALELVLGFAYTELGVSTGGSLVLADDSGNHQADRVVGDTYTGVIESLPESLQAAFPIALLGERQ